LAKQRAYSKLSKHFEYFQGLKATLQKDSTRVIVEHWMEYKSKKAMQALISKHRVALVQVPVGEKPLLTLSQSPTEEQSQAAVLNETIKRLRRRKTIYRKSPVNRRKRKAEKTDI
jgi:transcriptional accessory protein Tex/SPT6